MSSKLVISLIIFNIILGFVFVGYYVYNTFIDYEFEATGIVVPSKYDYSANSEGAIKTQEISYDLSSIADIDTIALFGVDATGSGDLDVDGHSDSIILVRFNHSNNTVKLVSIYRDTSIIINESGHIRKANIGYMMGGPEKEIELLEKNFDLKIDRYAAIDFQGLVDIINIVDGVDIEITDEESELLSIPSGWQKLNGEQALSYCRLRYAAGNDFIRAKRQRTVLTALYHKIQTVGIADLEQIAVSMLNRVSTSLSWNEILSFIMISRNIQIEELTGFPFKLDGKNYGGKMGYLNIPCNLETNVIELHNYLGEENYKPSDTVIKYSKKLEKFSGFDEDDGYVIQEIQY